MGEVITFILWRASLTLCLMSLQVWEVVQQHGDTQHRWGVLGQLRSEDIAGLSSTGSVQASPSYWCRVEAGLEPSAAMACYCSCWVA